MEDYCYAKTRKQEDDDGGVDFFQLMSTYDIKNALHDEHLPLSVNVYGPYKMMPPELLHTSGSVLIMYMFESLQHSMRGGQDRDLIDQQHIEISNLLKRQSERDFPRGSMRNGLIDGTKCQSSERKGNLFQLLCIAHTTIGSSIMTRSLSYPKPKWKQFIPATATSSQRAPKELSESSQRAPRYLPESSQRACRELPELLQ